MEPYDMEGHDSALKILKVSKKTIDWQASGKETHT